MAFPAGAALGGFASGLLDAGQAVQANQSRQLQNALILYQLAQAQRQQQQQQQAAGGAYAALQAAGQPPPSGMQQSAAQDVTTAQSQPPQTITPPINLLPPRAAAPPPPAVADQILSLEGNKDYAVGKAGELGPGQIKPSTGTEYGYKPAQLLGNSGRQASARIASDLYSRSGGDSAATLVGYNAGPGAMAKFQASGDSPAALPRNMSPAYRAAITRDIGQRAAPVAQIAGPQVAQMTTQGAVAATAQLDPIEYGRVQLQRMTQAIDAAMPDAEPSVKMLALIQAQKALAPEDQIALKMIAMQNQRAFHDLSLGLREQGLQNQLTLGQDRLAQGQQRLDQGEQRLADQEARAAAGGGQKYEASKTLEILDDKGNVQREVLARESRDQAGWIDSATGQRLQLKPGEQLREITPSTGGGGRAGAQVLRQEIGGREVLSDLQNVARLPVGSTTGMLGQYEPGTSLSGALHGDLARTLTGQDAQLMQSSLASMTRELSILMSPVYGGNYAARQIEPLVPKEGDTIGTGLFKIARLAQSADNALEALQRSPILSNDQKQYAADLRKQIGQAITWTPQQAQEFAQRGDDRQSFADFVKGGGLGGEARRSGKVIKLDKDGNVIP